MSRKFTSLLFALLMATGILFAQDRVITGKITSKDDGQTLPGVSVIVKGTSTGAISDIDGNYSITVPASGTTLVFSGVGFTSQEIVIGTSTSINPVLETDIKKLNEIVVTANAIEREKRSVGYGVSTVTGSDLTKGEERSLVNSLQGKVAGVQITSASGGVGSSSRIIIRGGSSLLGDNRPLMVVDGIPIQDDNFQTGDELNRQVDAGNRANDINPEDIESISILKGPAAAALYGSRASNGAVMITTKSGKALKGSGKNLSMTFSSGMTFETPLKLPEFQNQFGQGLPFFLHDLRENTSWGAPFDGVVRPWGYAIDGEQRVKPYVGLEDNVREFFDIGHTYTNNFSLAGNQDKTAYYFSFGNVKQTGIIPGTEYNRYSFKVSASTELSNHVSSSASVIYSKSNGDLSIQGQNTALSPWENIIQTPRDISLLELKDYKNKFNDLDGYYSPYTNNPWYTLNENSYENAVDHLIGNVQLNYKPLEWLTFDYRLGTDFYADNREEIHAIAKTNPASPRFADGSIDYPGFYQASELTGREINSDLTATIKRSINKDLKFSFILGQNVNERRNTSLISTAPQLIIPNFYNLSGVNGNTTTANVLNIRRLWGVYGSLAFDYKNFLFLELTGRNDHSSTLPIDNNSYFYPSANLSFVFTDAFKLSNKVLSFGKIALSYARVGKDAPAYSLSEVFTAPNTSNPAYTITDGHQGVQIEFPYDGIPGFTKGNTLANPNLTPEFTTAFEIGTELSFLNDRVGFNFNYYTNRSEDQIIPIQLPATIGYRAQFVNAATMTNKGIEMLLKVVPVVNKNFKWTLSVNYSKNTNNVEKLYGGLSQISIGNGTTFVGADLVAAIDKPWGQLLVTSFMRDPEGHVVCDPNTGLPITDPNDQLAGTVLPDYTMGINNAFTYKSWSFSFTFDIKQGGLLYSRTRSTMIFTGTDPATTFNNREPFIIPNSVVLNPDGSYGENTVEADPFTYFANSGAALTNVHGENLLDGSYVKLRELNISYVLPKRWMSKTPFGEITLTAYGRNLWISTPEENIYLDPEVSSFGTGNVQGYDYGALPSVRSFGGMVRFTF
ncbi:MAG: SusC/RagA family TonB-linked outer membrane protein [Bacteroidetes bacterium]|nr:SusC/RagA family TonB-linked outer membrane protein [Bacteroidota bacterium]